MGFLSSLNASGLPLGILFFTSLYRRLLEFVMPWSVDYQDRLSGLLVIGAYQTHVLEHVRRSDNRPSGQMGGLRLAYG